MNKSTHRKTGTISRHASTRNARCHVRAARRGGFTLIEILVVLVIAALIMAIVVSGFSSVSANNRRVSCQTNMTQLYAALRLYAADADGKFPYYGGKDKDMQTDTSDLRGIGLWALYTFPSNASSDKLAPAKNDNSNPLPNDKPKPVEVYLRKAGALHCPADDDAADISMFGTESGGVTPYNENYLSYQTIDTDFGNTQTYKTTRVDGVPTNADDKRQLLTYRNATDPLPRTPPTNTVITWCKWHRNQGNGRDIVLFYDGSVQSIDSKQDDPSGGATPLETWKRVPKPIQ